MQLGGVVKPNDGHCYTANGRYTASTIMVRQSNSLCSRFFLVRRRQNPHFELNNRQDAMQKNFLIKQETDYFLVFWSNCRTGRHLNSGVY